MAKVQKKENTVKETQNETATETPEAAVGEDNGKKRTNDKIKTVYLVKGADGKVTQSNSVPESGAVGIAVQLRNGFKTVLALKDVPQDMLIAAALFGLNTRLRNSVNTVPGDDVDRGQEILEGFVASLKSGSWRQNAGVGTGGVPLVIQALERAYAEAGKPISEAKLEQIKQSYAAMDTKQRAKQSDAWMKKGPVRKAYYAIEADRLAAKMAKVNEAEDELADL